MAENDELFGKRVVTLYSSLTCISIPLMLLLLIYTDCLFEIGKLKCFPVLLLLILFEFIKLSLSASFIENTKDSKIKTKKSCGKLRMKEITKSMLLVFGSTCLCYLIAVLFGAPILSKFEETFMFAALVNVLTVVACCIHLGVDVTLALLTGMTPPPGDSVMEMMQGIVQFTLFGAWIGAIVIPLDWERVWQAWPIPCSLGAIVGYLVAHIVAVIKLTPIYRTIFCYRQSGKQYV